MAFRYNNSPDRSEVCSFLPSPLPSSPLLPPRPGNIIAAGEAVYDIRDHVGDFGDSILMFDIHELCHAVLDHEDSAGLIFAPATAAAICLC